MWLSLENYGNFWYVFSEKFMHVMAESFEIFWLNFLVLFLRTTHSEIHVLWTLQWSFSRRRRGGSMTPDSDMSHSSRLPHPFVLPLLLVHMFLWPKHTRTESPTALHASFDAWHSLTSQNSCPFFTAFITCHCAYPTSFSFFPLPPPCNCAMFTLAGITPFALRSLPSPEEWHKCKVALISGKFPLYFFCAYW